MPHVSTQGVGSSLPEGKPPVIRPQTRCLKDSLDQRLQQIAGFQVDAKMKSRLAVTQNVWLGVAPVAVMVVGGLYS